MMLDKARSPAVNPERGTSDGVERRLVAAARDAGTRDVFVLRLYVAGSGERSMAAVDRIARLCETYIPGRYELAVIDIYAQPALAQEGDIVAAPTLVKHLPLPLRRVVGDMADEGRLLVALNVRKAS
jgi:circadian clock protein KaiB